MSVYSVNVYPSSTTIRTGDWYYGAYAIVNASSNCNTDVRWYSNNTSIATVNASSGYIYAKAPGTTRIYAQSIIDSSKNDYITVTVTSGTICVDSVTLNKSSISLEKGDTFDLCATVCPTNATNKSIIWRSSNTSVVTVSGGVVTAKARGYAYIYAEAQDGSGEYARCYVSVTEDTLVTSVTISPSSKTMNIGNSTYLYETVCPCDATNKCVKWSSNKTSVATVNPDTGLVIAQGAGTATITATAQDGSGKKGYCTITVNPPVAVTGVDVCPTSLTMNVGDIEYLCASITPSNATNQTVTWCSSNENVATVGLYTGKVTAKMAGATTITATTADGGFQDCITVNVNYCGGTSCYHDSWNELVFSNLDTLHQLARQYDSSNQIKLTLQFIRREVYNGSLWDTVAGEINQGFVNYVKNQNTYIYNFFTTQSLLIYDCNCCPIDFLHLCATMNGIIVGGGTYWKSLIVGQTHVRNLAGWAGDLQTLVVDTYVLTNASNNYNTFYNTFYQIMGSEQYSFGMKDLLADIDAFNFANNWISNYWQSNLFGSACRYYYNNIDIPGTGWTSRANLRFSQFFGSDTKSQFSNTVDDYTKQNWMFGIEWPLYESEASKRNITLNLTSNQSNAARDAFTDFMWFQLQKEK